MIVREKRLESLRKIDRKLENGKESTPVVNAEEDGN